MNLPQAGENIIQIKKGGQVTIPAKLLEFFPWLNQDSLIKARPTTEGLLLQPLKTTVNPEKKAATQKKTAKELLKEFAELARNDKNPNVNLTDFIIKDRESH